LAFTKKQCVKQARQTCGSNERKGFGGKRWQPIAEMYQHLYEEKGERHKNLFHNMTIYCSDSSLVFPNTSRKRQGFSKISRRVILVHK